MNVLIIEDEPLAADQLENLARKINKEIRVLNRIDSVRGSVKWFKANPEPDLVFMDIQLADGLSFEILEKVEVKAPIIFTTAYDEYALRAFKTNSIDYLLKPIDHNDLVNAFEKLENLTGSNDRDFNERVSKAIEMMRPGYKNRFIIKIGEHIKSVPVDDILYFFSRDKATFIHTLSDRNFPIDYSLDHLNELLDPVRFYRINRRYIVALDSIEDIISYSNSRLRLKLKNSDDMDIIVSRDRVGDFKSWLDR